MERRYQESGQIQAEVQRWQAHLQRLRGGHIDGQQIGAELENSVSGAFFAGETKSDILAGKYNEINNPIGLIRPRTLQGLIHFASACDITGKPPKLSRHDPWSAYNDPEPARKAALAARYGYVVTVKVFEELATGVLDVLATSSTFDPNKIKQVLESKLSGVMLFVGIPKYEYRDLITAHAEKPALWLLHSVLSILNHPSADIGLTVRLNALRLLNLYPLQDYAVRHQWNGTIGFDDAHIGRIPIKFQTDEDKSQPEHIYSWERNPNLVNIVIRRGGGSIEWLYTIQNLKKHPYEAVQLALLLLHQPGNIRNVVQFLQEIPDLEPQSALRMVSNSASFLAEHPRRKVDGADTGDRTQQPPAGEDEYMKALEAQLQAAQVQLAQEQGRASQLSVRIAALQAEIALKNAEISRLKQAQAKATAEGPRDNRFQVLGLAANCFDGMTDEQKKTFLEGLRRTYAQILHPDATSNLSEQEKKAAEERLKVINAAIDSLLGKNQRGRSR